MHIKSTYKISLAIAKTDYKYGTVDLVEESELPIDHKRMVIESHKHTSSHQNLLKKSKSKEYITSTCKRYTPYISKKSVTKKLSNRVKSIIGNTQTPENKKVNKNSDNTFKKVSSKKLKYLTSREKSQENPFHQISLEERRKSIKNPFNSSHTNPTTMALKVYSPPKKHDIPTTHSNLFFNF